MYGYQASYVHMCIVMICRTECVVYIVFVIQMSHPWKQMSLWLCS